MSALLITGTVIIYNQVWSSVPNWADQRRLLSWLAFKVQPFRLFPFGSFNHDKNRSWFTMPIPHATYFGYGEWTIDTGDSGREE